ncbi:MAG TPA: ABC transporter permease [Vicinamibacterales bacterium]|nr:ABC transporter permease [Vicinamibacterales bacterium]
MTPGDPSSLFRIGRWLLRLRLKGPRVDEADGDLRELWAARRAAGTSRLRREYARDVFGVLTHAAAARPAPARQSFKRFIGGDMRNMIHDFRYALRLMRRQPLFAGVTIVTLALGIAASTGIFTTVDRLLLQPLPYPHPEQLMTVKHPPYSFGGDRMSVQRGVEELGVFSGIGLYAPGGLNIDTLDQPLRVEATVASPGFFSAMGVWPAIGRPYTAEEDVPGANAVAVISDGLWRRHFGADPDVLDRPLYVNRQPFRVAGVMPPGFTFPGRTDVWIPVSSDRQATGDAFAPAVVARLLPGVTREAAKAALARFDQDRGAPADGNRPGLVPLQDELTSGARPTLLLLAVSVGLVLLVSTSNVAGLLLARVTRRQSEFVLRRALGGSRWRLTRLLCVEALTFAALAGVLGALGGTVALRAISALSADHLPVADLTSVDARMLGIAVAVSGMAGLLFGLVPGLAASSAPAAHVMRTGETVTAGRNWWWFRHAMVVLQVAVALVLLSVTTMTIQTMARLARVDLGFSGQSVLGVEVTLPIATYPGPADGSAFAERALERLVAIPGIASAAATGRLPGDRTTGVGISIDLPGANRPADAPRRFASLLSASPDYFAVMGIRLIAGRRFTAADTREAPPVVILSESAAGLLWPDGRNPVGERITAGFAARAPTYEVVGIVNDVLLWGPHEPARPQLYRPFPQGPPFGFLSFAVGTSIDAEAVVPAVRAAIGSLDPGLPVYNVQQLDEVAARFLASHRLAMTLMGGFALMTLVLAAVGLYGVLAQLVTERTRELGIRMALGADGRRLQRGVVLSGLRLAGAGTIVGVLLAGVAARAVAAFVPDLDPLPWQTIGLDASIILAVTVAAAWLPARRAATIDVARTLRA